MNEGKGERIAIRFFVPHKLYYLTISSLLKIVVFRQMERREMGLRFEVDSSGSYLQSASQEGIIP
jgi:hypothetical protein